MNKPAPALALSEGQRQTLQRLSRSTSAAHRLVVRSRALLLAGDGVANARIAAECGVAVSTVVGGRKPSIPASKVEEIVRLTQEGRPAGETHWSCRSMAKASDVSPATVQRIWSGRGLKPHLVKTFKLSNDPRFEEKLIDVVGLYLNPPE